MVSGFLSCFETVLALAELRRATGGLEAVFLSLLHSRISGQESGLLQHGSVVRICMQQSSGDSMTDGACLSGETAAVNVY